MGSWWARFRGWPRWAQITAWVVVALVVLSAIGGATGGSKKAASSASSSSTSSGSSPSLAATVSTAVLSSATCTDPVGDMQDAHANITADPARLDIVTAVITRNADASLTITLTMAGKTSDPNATTTALASVLLSNVDGTGYQVLAQYDEPLTTFEVNDLKQNKSKANGTVEGATIVVDVPADSVKNLGPTFRWSVTTEGSNLKTGQAGFDSCPDGGNLPFPA